ncbi:MAG: DUF3105 domain-containing protein [Paracoccaceae bacterium]
MKKNSPGPDVKYGANIGQTSRRTNLTISGLAVLALAAVGYFWWNSTQTDRQSDDLTTALAQEGQAVLARVRSPGSQGNRHLDPGQTKAYVEIFPTSGDHSATPVKAGVYGKPMPKVNLVHSLEHGNIVIYFDNPGEEAEQFFKDWSSLYTGSFGSVIATKSPGLEEAVVLTAWTKSLRLDRFDAASAAAFVDAYRGRGPERVVR